MDVFGGMLLGSVFIPILLNIIDIHRGITH